MLCSSCTRDLEPDARFCGLCGAAAAPLDARYRLEERIASGGFGTIYRATCVTSGDALAIKVLHADLARSEALAQRFRREGATLASLRHPHTLRTFEAGETGDGTLYIAMELLDGESLRQRFEARGPLPWREVVAMLRATCLALAEAHRRGIVHRDLTPSNIFLARNPARRGADFVKVLDFGVAGIIHGSARDFGERLTRYGEIIGTLAYLSPEQSVGQAVDARSDLYSLGVVAYEMITGHRPFQHATTPLALITALHTEDVVAPSTHRADVPPELDAILLRCLAREPAERPASAEVLVDALEELASGFARGSSAEISVPPLAAGTPATATTLGLGGAPTRLAAALLAAPKRSGELISLGDSLSGETAPRLDPARLCAHCVANGPPALADSMPGVTAPRIAPHVSLSSLGETSPRMVTASDRSSSSSVRLPARSGFRSQPTAQHSIALDETALDNAIARSLDSATLLHASSASLSPPVTAPADDASSATRRASSSLLLAGEVTPPRRMPFLVKLVLCVVLLSLGGFALGGGLAYFAG